MLSRRAFGARLAVLPFAGGALRAATAPDAAHGALLQQFATTFLKRSPEEATGAGFDVGANAGLRALLDDRSIAARASDRAGIAEAQALLAAVDRAALGPAARLDHDVARFVCDTLADLLTRPGYVDLNLRPSPYVVSQMNGAYYWLPGFFAGHPLATRDDAAAWLSRLAALSTALDQETERVAADAAAGVVPPDFVITRTLAQLAALRNAPARSSPLVAPALRRAAAAGLPDMSGTSAIILATRIVPALDRQMAALRAVAPRASGMAGVWHLPDGEAYYAAALRANTTADLSPTDLHRDGLAQCTALAADIDRLLRAQGMASGSLAERLQALDIDPRFRVADSDQGRARILAAARQALEKVTARLPGAFSQTGVRPLEVQRMVPANEAGSPGAFYSGGNPGVIVLNLGIPSQHPLWRLPTLLHHEGIPGHHYQASVLDGAAGLPLFRRIVRFSAYTEGWALYAERVADELGVFADDPFGRIGALQSQLFRAARIVVDTGLHHKRWTLAEAARWMVENAGEQPEASLREVVRYSVYPGQACSFKVGADRIHAAREAARAAMGPRFGVDAFHDVVLKSGPVPMTVLEAATQAWSAA